MPMYTDINPLYGVVPGITDLRCYDGQAIVIGLINTLNTMVDPDGISERPFRPNFPNQNFNRLLEEPIDDMTAFQINMALESILANNPRATFDPNNTSVVPNLAEAGFDISISLIDKITGQATPFAFLYTQQQQSNGN